MTRLWSPILASRHWRVPYGRAWHCLSSVRTHNSLLYSIIWLKGRTTESDDPFALARKESLPPAPLPPSKTKLANPLAKGPRALSTTRAAAPRVGVSRSVSTTRLAPSDSATSTRSHPAAAASRLRTASSAAAATTTTTTTTKALANTTVKALPAARAKAPLTSVPKNPALTRPGSSSSVARAALEKKALAGESDGEAQAAHVYCCYACEAEGDSRGGWLGGDYVRCWAGG